MTKDDNRPLTPFPPAAQGGFAMPFETPLGAAVIAALAPYKTYYVGGCVRDALLGLPTAPELDMATAAPPEEAAKRLAALGGQLLPGGLGAVRVEGESGRIELTSMRTEGPYADRRHPDWVEFVADPRLDACRRDFTAGAVYWGSEEGLLDPVGGVADIRAGLLRTVGKPENRFDEDPLRMLRGLRFAARFGFAVEGATADAMRRMAPLLGFVSGERALPELYGMLKGDHIEAVLMEYGDVLSALVPEIRPALRCPQKSRFHCYGVWEHTAKAVAVSPPDPLLRLALLLHDLGKPCCRRRDAAGNDHFQGHMREGAAIARRTAERLSLPKEQARELETLVSLHDDRIRRRVPDVARLLGQMGETATRRLIELRAADNAAKAPAVREPSRREEMHALVDEILRSGLPLTRKDLAVTGSSVPAEGPMVGAALDQLLEAIWNGEIKNEREALLRHLQEMYDY
ncbi:MAG TPA: HD domain-containing protein [Candidatus Acidoferrum sp.]|nr:HD domain-containing protein [Candidatus Acidoferrum sp.]